MWFKALIELNSQIQETDQIGMERFSRIEESHIQEDGGGLAALVNALNATIGLTRSPDAISPHVCGIIVTR